MLMKRILLLVSFCCFGFIMQAQDFFTKISDILLKRTFIKVLTTEDIVLGFTGLLVMEVFIKRALQHIYLGKAFNRDPFIVAHREDK